MIYHVFWPLSARSAYDDLTLPVVASIATLRAVNQAVSVYVLECGKGRNWGEFPEKLNFKVVPWEFELFKHDVARENHTNKFCSRVSDVVKFADSTPHDLILYADVDCFWRADPFPLEFSGDRFCVQNNFGFFYYKKQPKALAFIEAYQSNMIHCLYDEEYCAHTHEVNDWGKPQIVVEQTIPWDESCLAATRKDLPNHHCVLSSREHNLFLIPCEGVKMEHLTTMEFVWKGENLRGLAAVVFSEFYDLVSKVLSQQDLCLIYGEDFGLFKSYRVSYEELVSANVLSSSNIGVRKDPVRLEEIMGAIRSYRIKMI